MPRLWSSAVGLVAGVFLGSAGWWLLLSGSASLLRTRILTNWMQAINRVSGATILVYGLYALFCTQGG